MLVLSRKTDERIMLSDGVTLTIVRIDGDKVRIGIDAPADIDIFREEIASDEILRRAARGRGVHRGARSAD